MAGKWHKMMVQILRELCEEDIKSGVYSKVCDGNSEPIPVTYKKQTYYYQPDLYGVYVKSELVDIYEVIDTESEGEAVMDSVYSALTPRINVLCVVCSNDIKLEAIKKHARIILHKIFTEHKKSYAKIYNQKYFVYMPRKTKGYETIKKELKKRMWV